MIRFSAVITLLSIILTPVFSFSSSQDNSFARPLMKTEEEMLLFFEEEVVLVSATLHPQKLSEAPAIASVIKEDEIRNMGARDLIDVLNKIPGIHVTKGYYGKEEIESRGIKTDNSEKIKLLIDGHSVNDLLTGGATWVFDSLTVDNLKRIEVIRGPGSALYGSNAFSAVVNVITKDGKDIDGVLLSVGRGNFNTSKINLQAGKKFNDLEIALSLDYFKTDGDELTIEKDKANYIPGFENRVPGKTKDDEKKYDIGLRLKYKDFSLHSKYTKRKRSAYLGGLYFVTDESWTKNEHFFGELIYSKAYAQSSMLTAKTYIDRANLENYWELLPEDIYPPDGMIGNPSAKEKTIGAELQIDHELFTNNLLTAGALKEKRQQYDVKHKANFNPLTCTSAGCAPTSSGDIENVANWNQEKTRHTWAAYVQDIWDINSSINLTVGVRHDEYSDFGQTNNPRLGLVWKFINTWDLKVLYATAFRAPSFEELYNTNNNAVLGNANLNAEKMKTLEISIGHSYTENDMARATYFDNRFKDKIQLVNGQYQNTGGAEVWGIELEWNRNFTKTTSTYLNFTYQHPEDKETGKRLADVASHKGNIGLNMGLSRYFNINTNIFISGKRPRSTTDTRTAARAYELVDMTLIAKNFLSTFELRCAVHNLFDRDYEDPSPVFETTIPNVYLPTIPNDFPREGRSFMLEASYKF